MLRLSFQDTTENTKETSMSVSIPQFDPSSIEKLVKVQEKFLRDPSTMAEFFLATRDEFLRMGLDFITQTLNSCDEMLRGSAVRLAKGWQIVRRDSRTLTTSLGDVRFQKTLFRNNKTGETCYLADRILGIGDHQRITDDAFANLLAEAVQTSYRRGGEEASALNQVSRETVKEKIHELEFPDERDQPEQEKKRAPEYLFIDADEDHASLQFNRTKGDLKVSSEGYKINTIMTKLVYVYEGIEPAAPKSSRNRLVHPHYFSGVYSGADNEKLWEEVYAYLEHTYDLAKVKKIYIQGDGAAWIVKGHRHLDGLTMVLDEFHLRKYITGMTRHLSDRAADMNAELVRIIRKGSREEFRKQCREILSYAQTEGEKVRVLEGKKYILQNWNAARARFTEDPVRGCSAEGHVSHVLSSRMSSRPMGWSRTGADKMARLRAYYYNKGDMLELIRKQSKIREAKAAAGAEEVTILRSNVLIQWENQHRKAYGKYFDAMQAGISRAAAQEAWFRGHIWGL